MGCIQVIREGYGGYTETDQRIADYLLNRYDEIPEMNVGEIAAQAGVSGAAVIRFAKKIGYSGFSELKIALAKEPREQKSDHIKTVLKESDSLETMAQKIARINLDNVEATYQLIQTRNLGEVVQAVDEAKNIYLFGLGASGLVALDLQQKFSRIHRSVYFHQDVHTNLSAIASIEPEDAAILISYSGERREVLLAAEAVKEQGAKLIAITQMNHNHLMRMADFCLFMPNEEQKNRVGAITSRISALLLTDLIYLAIAHRHIESTETNIQRTSELVSRL